MILKESYSKERIAEFRNYADFNKSDPAIIEKMIRAFVLLEHLSNSKLNFVFKGGTCMILLLNHPNRFSIDIDILTTVTREELEQKLDFVINNSEFTHYKLDKKRSYDGNIPKAHYKFYWTDERKDYILLDILFEEHKYPEIIQTEIQTDWLISKAPY